MKDTFVKLVDTLVTQSGRLEDGLRRSNLGELLAGLGLSPFPLLNFCRHPGETVGSSHEEQEKCEGAEEKRPSTPTPTSASAAQDVRRRGCAFCLTEHRLNYAMNIQLVEFLAERVVPNFKRFLIDPDKSASLCSNIMYYIVTPALKSRTKSVTTYMHFVYWGHTLTLRGGTG
jgi:hypothetical protein